MMNNKHELSRILNWDDSCLSVMINFDANYPTIRLEGAHPLH